MIVHIVHTTATVYFLHGDRRIINLSHWYRAGTRINRSNWLPISRYSDKLSATYRGQIAVFKIVSFFTTPAYLIPSKSRKSRATKYTAFKTNSALNKHRISKNYWTVIASSLSSGAEPSERQVTIGSIAKFTRV